MSAAPPPWLRRMVIRGDVATAGVALGLLGLLAAGASATGVLPAWGAAVAVAGVAGGGAMVAWARRTWAALVAEVRARRADYQPPPAPTWVEAALWAARNAYDPELDPESELQAEVDRDWGSFEADVRRAFVAPRLRLVTEDERELAGGVSPIPATAPDDLLAALEATPGRHLLSFPRWPVCCGRLTTLVALDAGPEDGLELPESGEAALPRLDVRLATLDQEIMRPQPSVAPRLSAFRCAACGGRYRSAWG